MLFRRLVCGFMLLCGFSVAPVAAHEGPDPIAHWLFTQRAVRDGKVLARFGPPIELAGRCEIVGEVESQALWFGGVRAEGVVAADFRRVRRHLPAQEMTVSAWCTVDTAQRWGGITGVIQDNSDAEYGWILGYDDKVFTFALATVGADDGDGLMTYLAGRTPYEAGRFYHVVGVYDGLRMQLFVNGELEAESEVQSGAILYPEAAVWTMGSYRDDNEFYPHHGRVREVALYDLAARPAWIAAEFQHGESLARQPAEATDLGLDFVVEPYLQYGTTTSMTVMWQTTKETAAEVHYGTTAACEQVVGGAATGTIHEVTIGGMEPETQYFYRIQSTAPDGETLVSEVSTWVTAVLPTTPFAFAVISDTQGNPEVAGKIAKMAWAQRPSFLLHPGDLVDTGTNNLHWTQHFFPSLNELIRRVPFYPVLGNHELNARNYFDYVALPDPEYYYQFRYGNAQFFMIDSNREIAPGSEQYEWLEQELAESDAVWKFVCHHHPPYSSDENDYGNLWHTNVSTRGDRRARQLVALYDEYQVDIVWNGHIHSYERTWPLRRDRAAQEGTIYMITGGGGGGLETPGPFRPYFQNNVRRGHHYVMVAVNGRTLEMKAFDLEGRLFDMLRIEKRD